MKKSIGSVFLAFIFLTILLSGCAPASTPVPSTLTPIPPTDIPVPTATPTTTTSSIKITTSAGDVAITKVEIVSEDAFGSKAAPGYQILYVWFESADGSEIDGGAFYDASKDVYIMGDDGSKTKSYTGGVLSGELMVGFTPPDSAHKFTLFWPGNDPIELTLSQ